jgi:hypothetical protein
MTTKVKIFQGGTDGFGHQLEGTLRLLSLSINNKAEYQYNYSKNYSFEHKNYNFTSLINYISEGLKFLSTRDIHTASDSIGQYNIMDGRCRTFDDITNNDIDYQNTIYYYDGVGAGDRLPPNFEAAAEVKRSLPLLREAFVLNNSELPKPSYDNTYINVCCHIRLGDAQGTRTLDTESLFKVVKYYQSMNNEYRIIIHSDGDVSSLAHENTIIYDKNTDVMQVLSDFIYTDILIMNYSSLSIAAHYLADNNQKVICPNVAGPTFNHRILSKCITCDKFLKMQPDEYILWLNAEFI